MIGTGDGTRPPIKSESRIEPTDCGSSMFSRTDDLHLRVQQLSLREQIERNHFLLVRLNAASARLIEALEHDDVFDAIAEIIANLIGSEEIAVFDYYPANQNFSLARSWGVEADALQSFLCGAGMLSRAVQQSASQFRDRQPETALLPHEKNLTACIVLKSSREIAGVIAIFGLLPQKERLEWADYELLRFLETYAAVALQFHRLQRKQTAP